MRALRTAMLVVPIVVTACSGGDRVAVVAGEATAVTTAATAEDGSSESAPTSEPGRAPATPSDLPPPDIGPATDDLASMVLTAGDLPEWAHSGIGAPDPAAAPPATDCDQLDAFFAATESGGIRSEFILDGGSSESLSLSSYAYELGSPNRVSVILDGLVVLSNACPLVTDELGREVWVEGLEILRGLPQAVGFALGTDDAVVFLVVYGQGSRLAALELEDSAGGARGWQLISSVADVLAAKLDALDGGDPLPEVVPPATPTADAVPTPPPFEPLAEPDVPDHPLTPALLTADDLGGVDWVRLYADSAAEFNDGAVPEECAGIGPLPSLDGVAVVHARSGSFEDLVMHLVASTEPGEAVRYVQLFEDVLATCPQFSEAEESFTLSEVELPPVRGVDDVVGFLIDEGSFAFEYLVAAGDDHLVLVAQAVAPSTGGAFTVAELVELVELSVGRLPR